MVIAANKDNVFRRLCETMGQPELADDPRYATHLARGDNQEEIEGIVADWAVLHDADDLDRMLNEAGVVCGPIYTVAEIFEDQHFKAREMLVEHDDPEFGPYIGPGIVPKFVARRARCGGLAPGRRAATTRTSTAGCSASPIRTGRAAQGWSGVRITICDVGPRDGLQNQPVTLEPAVRAELVDRLADAGLPRIEAVSFVNPGACRRWPEPRRSSRRSTSCRESSYAGLVLERTRLRALTVDGRLDRVHGRVLRQRDVQRAQPGNDRR